MIDFAVEVFVAHVKIVYLACGLTSACGYVALNRRRFRLSEIISAGLLGASVPVGMLLILAAFRPALTDELREFSLETALLGLVYIVYAAREIARICGRF